MHRPLPKESRAQNQEKNYKSKSLTAIASKVYNALFLNCIWPRMKKICGKNQNDFWRNHSTTSQILTIHRIIEGIQTKDLEATLLFLQGIQFHTQRKYGANNFSIGFPKETLTTIMMLYKNTKVMVRSPDRDTDFFDIVARVLQEDTLAPYLFIFSLNYALQTSMDLITDNGFTLKKEKSRQYPAETMTDAEFIEDLAFLITTPAQAESQLHS